MASDFGSGLGSIIGGALASDTLSGARNDIAGQGANFLNLVSPNIQFGQSFLPQAQSAIAGAGNFAAGTKSYDDFMKSYETSPAAQYQIQQGTEATNNSAAARGGLLSGSNLRALSTMQQGIASQNANQAWQNYLSGNQNQFGQLQSIIGNMFSGINAGSTATGQYGGVLGSQMSSQAALAQAQAKADQGKGSGFGSLFSGVGSMFGAF